MANPNETLSVTIRIRRRPGAPRLPDQSDWTAIPPARHRFISRQDFAAQYGAAPADLDRVVDFARVHDLTVMESNVARRTVVVSATVEKMSRAFAVDLGYYESPRGTYRGREGYIFLPDGLADIVEGVSGLDNRRMARRSNVVLEPAVGSKPLTPPQIAQLYGFPVLPPGARVRPSRVLEFGGGFVIDANGRPTDIQTFFSGLGLGTPNLAVVSVDGQSNTPTGDPAGMTPR